MLSHFYEPPWSPYVMIAIFIRPTIPKMAKSEIYTLVIVMILVTSLIHTNLGGNRDWGLIISLSPSITDIDKPLYPKDISL